MLGDNCDSSASSIPAISHIVSMHVPQFPRKIILEVDRIHKKINGMLSFSRHMYISTAYCVSQN